MNATTLIHELDALSPAEARRHLADRVRALSPAERAEWGAQLLSGDHRSREIAVLAARIGGDTAVILAAMQDRSAHIRVLAARALARVPLPAESAIAPVPLPAVPALAPVPLPGEPSIRPTAESALAPVPLSAESVIRAVALSADTAQRRALWRSVRAERAREIAEILLPAAIAAGRESEAAQLLATVGEDTARRYADRLLPLCEILPGVAQRFPELIVEDARGQLAGADIAAIERYWERHGEALAVAVRERPGLAAEVLALVASRPPRSGWEAENHGSLWNALWSRLPNEAALVFIAAPQSEIGAPIPHNRAARVLVRSGGEAIGRILTDNVPEMEGFNTRLLLIGEPPLLRELLATAAPWTYPIGVRDRYLAAEHRVASARKSLDDAAVTPAAVDAEGVLAWLPWEEAVVALRGLIRASEPQERVSGYRGLLIAASFDSSGTRLVEALGEYPRLRTERDPVRAEALAALAEVPRGLFRGVDPVLLERIVDDALAAPDTSPSSVGALAQLALRLVVLDEPRRSWALATLRRLDLSTTWVMVPPLSRALDALIAEALLERPGSSIAEVVRFFGDQRATAIPTIDAAIEAALFAGDRDLLTLWLTPRRSRLARIRRLLGATSTDAGEADLSAFALPLVERAVLGPVAEALRPELFGQDREIGAAVTPGFPDVAPAEKNSALDCGMYDGAVFGAGDEGAEYSVSFGGDSSDRWFPAIHSVLTWSGQQRRSAVAALLSVATEPGPEGEQALRLLAQIPEQGEAALAEYARAERVAAAGVGSGAETPNGTETPTGTETGDTPEAERRRELLLGLGATSLEEECAALRTAAARTAGTALSRRARTTAPAQIPEFLGTALGGSAPRIVGATALLGVAEHAEIAAIPALRTQVLEAVHSHPDVVTRSLILALRRPGEPESWALARVAAPGSPAAARAVAALLPERLTAAAREEYALILADLLSRGEPEIAAAIADSLRPWVGVYALVRASLWAALGDPDRLPDPTSAIAALLDTGHADGLVPLMEGLVEADSGPARERIRLLTGERLLEHSGAMPDATVPVLLRTAAVLAQGGYRSAAIRLHLHLTLRSALPPAIIADAMRTALHDRCAIAASVLAPLADSHLGSRGDGADRLIAVAREVATEGSAPTILGMEIAAAILRYNPLRQDARDIVTAGLDSSGEEAREWAQDHPISSSLGTFGWFAVAPHAQGRDRYFGL